MMRRIERALAVTLLGAIVLLVTVAALARAAGHPVIWSVEVAQLLFAWLAVIAADLALQGDRHFRLALLDGAIPPRLARPVEILRLLVLVLLLAYLLVHALRNAGLQHAQLVGSIQFRASLIHAAMVAGLLLMLRTLAVRILALLRPEARR